MIPLNASNRSIRNILSKFGQGAFYATAVGPQTIPTGATPTMVALGTESIDVCSWFAASTLTPKQPGYYLLIGQTFFNDAVTWTSSEQAHLYIRKNGTAVPSYGVTTVPSMSVVSFALVEANGTTDAFDLAARHYCSGDVDIYLSSFGGVFVSYDNP